MCFCLPCQSRCVAHSTAAHQACSRAPRRKLGVLALRGPLRLLGLAHIAKFLHCILAESTRTLWRIALLPLGPSIDQRSLALEFPSEDERIVNVPCRQGVTVFGVVAAVTEYGEGEEPEQLGKGVQRHLPPARGEADFLIGLAMGCVVIFHDDARPDLLGRLFPQLKAKGSLFASCVQGSVRYVHVVEDVEYSSIDGFLNGVDIASDDLVVVITRYWPVVTC